MLFWLEEAGVETAMIVAVVVAAVLFVWALWSLVDGWMRLRRPAPVESGSSSPRIVAQGDERRRIA